MTPLATILRAMREGRDDYTLQQQIDAMRVVIATGEQPKLRVRFEKADARYQTGRSV